MRIPRKRQAMATMKTHARALALGAAALVAGCGGGSLYIGIDGSDDQPPRAELVADRTQAVPGQLVRLAAAASDDGGYVERVRFYRIDGGDSTLISVDTSAPFEATLVVPNDGRSSVSVFARAVDGFGQAGDSAVVTISIVP
jgi:hypothetical protein